MNTFEICQEHVGLSSSGSQEGLIARPQSKLEACCCWLMYRASSTLLSQQFPSISLVLAAFQSTWCWLVQAWAAIQLLVLCFFTAFLCSLRCFSRFLLVSPMYTYSQVLHGTSQTTLFFFLSSENCFTCTRAILRVLLDLQTVFNPNTGYALLILSLIPGMYRRSWSLGGV